MRLLKKLVQLGISNLTLLQWDSNKFETFTLKSVNTESKNICQHIYRSYQHSWIQKLIKLGISDLSKIGLYQNWDSKYIKKCHGLINNESQNSYQHFHLHS